MVKKEKSYIKALSAFLQEQGSLIERHMPEELNIFTKAPKKPTERDSKKNIRALKA
jgi:hypothetical protein